MGESNLNSPKPQKQHGRYHSCVTIGMILLLLIIVASGGVLFGVQSQEPELLDLYFASRQGQPGPTRPVDEATAAGQITIRNSAVRNAWIDLISSDQAGRSSTLSYQLQPFDQQTITNLAGSYDVQFYRDFDGSGARPAPLATCALLLQRGHNYQFIVLNGRVLVSLEGTALGPDNGTAQSELCRH